MAARRETPAALRSPILFRLFAYYLRLRVRRGFHAIRLSGQLPVVPRGQPVIVFANHPSWWDPAVFIILGDTLFRGRPGYGPMESDALRRYGFFRRLGAFGIEKNTAAGARRFLEIARAVLAEPGAMIWVTAEGNFTDPRVRPVRLRPGVAHLARSIPDAVLLPLAVEYVFWNESRPELLVRFGNPIAADAAIRPAEWTQRLQTVLAREMDALAADSASREKQRFQTLLSGTVGSSMIYDTTRRLAALLRGRHFSPAHEEEA
ncbi:lysophospholipid acyltransferase family protein [Lichenicoccus sp.]|uniref:lysophospholipid acyltransferase family protein n=1 Tax=Lichenicoccus sp. TaxID=2781899 RepID=UPI003D1264BA